MRGRFCFNLQPILINLDLSGSREKTVLPSQHGYEAVGSLADAQRPQHGL